MATCDQFVFAVRNEPPSSVRRKEAAALPWRSAHRMERSAARGPTEVWTKGCVVVLQAALTPRSVGKEAVRPQDLTTDDYVRLGRELALGPGLARSRSVCQVPASGGQRYRCERRPVVTP